MTSEKRFTLVFEGDIREQVGNPFKVATPYGLPVAIAADDAIERAARLEEAIEALEAVQHLAGHCPCCGEMRNRDHAPDCKLSLALQSFRGETS